MQEETVVQEEVSDLQPVNLISRQVKLDPKMYTIFRLDGHSFSRFVKKFKMQLPFDSNFTTAMKNTALEAFTYFRFFIGFVGSDQITYAMKPLTNEDLLNNNVLQFNGRIEKMTSLLAGKVSTNFFIELSKLQGFQKTKQFCPHFDCRVYQVFTYKDVLDNIGERIVYTLKNSRMMLAQSHFNQKQLNNIPSNLAVEKLLVEKQIDYNKVVHADNRVGSVIVYQKVQEQKDIQVKGEVKHVYYERRKPKTLNLGPKQIFLFKQEQLL